MPHLPVCGITGVFGSSRAGFGVDQGQGEVCGGPAQPPPALHSGGIPVELLPVSGSSMLQLFIPEIFRDIF